MFVLLRRQFSGSHGQQRRTISRRPSLRHRLELLESRFCPSAGAFTGSGNGLVTFLTSEADQRRDLNGDGDKHDQVLQSFDARTGVVHNSGQQAIAGSPANLGNGLIVFLTSEADQRRDLNGDGDKIDQVLQSFDAKTGAVHNSGQQAIAGSQTDLGSGLLAFLTSEADQRRDLDGDGDKLDEVLQSFDAKTGFVHNSGQQAIADSITDLGNGLLAFLTSETDQRRDLNGDGDKLDQVLQSFDAKTGVVHNSGQQAITGSLTDLGNGLVIFLTSEAGQRRDLNGDGDRLDQVLQSFDAKTGAVHNSGQQAIAGSLTV